MIVITITTVLIKCCQGLPYLLTIGRSLFMFVFVVLYVFMHVYIYIYIYIAVHVFSIPLVEIDKKEN